MMLNFPILLSETVIKYFIYFFDNHYCNSHSPFPYDLKQH